MGWSTMFHAKLLKDVDCILRLVHSEVGGVAFKLNSEISLNRAEVVGSEGLCR